jgi:prepilin-type N-terminal cleavage/methylation domain-containing protein
MLFFKKKWHVFAGENGFTLIEMIAVLAIIGILSTIAVPRFMNVATSSEKHAIYIGVSEINSREATLWAKLKISSTGWLSDEDLFSQMDTDLGNDYKWTPSAEIGGAKLQYKEQSLTLERIASTNKLPGKWEVTQDN